MTCTDISVEPSGYIGFIRIYISAKGYPSVASSAGDNLISGYIVRSEVSTKDIPVYLLVQIQNHCIRTFTAKVLARNGYVIPAEMN